MENIVLGFGQVIKRVPLLLLRREISGRLIIIFFLLSLLLGSFGLRLLLLLLCLGLRLLLGWDKCDALLDVCAGVRGVDVLDGGLVGDSLHVANGMREPGAEFGVESRGSRFLDKRGDEQVGDSQTLADKESVGGKVEVESVQAANFTVKSPSVRRLVVGNLAASEGADDVVVRVDLGVDEVDPLVNLRLLDGRVTGQATVWSLLGDCVKQISAMSQIEDIHETYRSAGWHPPRRAAVSPPPTRGFFREGTFP